MEFAFWAGPNILSQAVANFCALYALTVWTPPRRFAVGFAIVMTAVLATSLGPGATLKQAVGFGLVEGVVMLLVRRVIGDRDRRAQIAERERDVAAREAVVEERARIARELHDVIAHHVSMIVLQAGAERRVLGEENASTREVLETVEQSGRSALTETRRLLGHAPRRRERSAHAAARASTTCPCSSGSFVTPACLSSSPSTGSDASCRSVSSCPRTGSSRRR